MPPKLKTVATVIKNTIQLKNDIKLNDLERNDSNEYFEKGEKIFELEPFNYRQEFIKRKSQLEEMKNELKSQNLIYEVFLMGGILQSQFL